MLPFCPTLTRHSIVTEIRNWRKCGSNYGKYVAKRLRRSARREEATIIHAGLTEHEQILADETYRNWFGAYPENVNTVQEANLAICADLERDYYAHLERFDSQDPYTRATRQEEVPYDDGYSHDDRFEMQHY